MMEISSCFSLKIQCVTVCFKNTASKALRLAQKISSFVEKNDGVWTNMKTIDLSPPLPPTCVTYWGYFLYRKGWGPGRFSEMLSILRHDLKIAVVYRDCQRLVTIRAKMVLLRYPCLSFLKLNIFICDFSAIVTHAFLVHEIV